MATGTNQFMQWAVQAICGQNVTATTALGGQTMKLHSVAGTGDATAANAIAGIPAAAVTWGAPAPTGGGNVKITGTIPAPGFTVTTAANGVDCTHYGIYNGAGTFLYGKPLSSKITVPPNSTVTVQVTAEMFYEIN